MESSTSLDAAGALQKTAVVLDVYQAGEGPNVTFKGDGIDGTVFLTVPKATYEDLGYPAEVTVEVTPGNTLQTAEEVEAAKAQALADYTKAQDQQVEAAKVPPQA